MAQSIVLFPGQGSQGVGMGRELSEAFPEARAVFEMADAAAGAPIRQLCFEGPLESLTETVNAQPAVTAVNLAVWAVLSSLGLEPVAAAGHSLGEYAAACAAGVLTPEQAIRLTRRRGAEMQACADCRPGGMAAIIGLPMDRVAECCARVADATGKTVSVANDNSPEQVVITGESEGVRAAVEALTAAGAKRAVELAVSGPWHSPLMQPAQEAFGRVLAAEPFADPLRALYANIDASRKETGAAVREALVRQVTGAVRWTGIVRALRAAYPEAVFVECGPGRVLKGLLRSIDRDAVCVGVECPRSLEQAKAKLGL